MKSILRYDHHTTSSGLINLCSDYQWLLMSQKEKQPNIIYLLIEEHSTAPPMKSSCKRKQVGT